MKFRAVPVIACALTAYIFLGLTSNAHAQQPAYYNDILAFNKHDKEHGILPGQILFLGSSTFTKWTDVQEYFPEHDILNRAFGGATFPDVIRYAYEMIITYKPKMVVIYCGDNDIAEGADAQTILKRFKTLAAIVLINQPTASIAFVSIKPSPSRIKYLSVIKHANNLIGHYIAGQQHMSYVNVYDSMVLPNGKINRDIFTEDMLHINSKGYKLWQKTIQPYLH